MSAALMLREWHRRSGTDRPSPATAAVDGLPARVRYIESEVEELAEAVEAADVVAIADALADIAYLVYGTADRCGIDLDRVLAEVHRSNLTKTSVPGDGKAIKGPGYQPPRLTPENIGFYAARAGVPRP